jgi:hypothetical protein
MLIFNEIFTRQVTVELHTRQQLVTHSGAIFNLFADVEKNQNEKYLLSGVTLSLRGQPDRLSVDYEQHK